MAQPLRIERRLVDDGLALWSGMAAELESAVTVAVTRIEQLHAAAPWGDDASAREFLQAYMAENGPNVLISWSKSQIGQIIDTGTAVRQSVDGSAEADAEAFTRRT
ncbi:hypothetical protein ITP53_01965 [Nonomuraea sp. K274]|uniref:Uncharacterized protein n=1 Tax=Nonomuraea cypriaca TaxID=1187855 RepID=A0A931A3V9_9ACTN|nr:hypothetical protein [Nonomuraea cypriaca]MBF8184530.1 hypothetical protein [Nonomuraea cypriaca]